MKRVTRKRVILAAAILAALAGAFAAFWHLGGWRLFDPYAGRAFNLDVKIPTGYEVVFEGVSKAVSEKAKAGPIWKRLTKKVSESETHSIIKIVTITPQAGSDWELMGVLTKHSCPKSAGGIPLTQAYVFRRDLEGRPVSRLKDDLQAPLPSLALCVREHEEMPYSAGKITDEPREVGETWSAVKHVENLNRRTDYRHKFQLVRIREREGNLCALVEFTTEWKIGSNGQMGTATSAKGEQRGEYLFDLKRGVSLSNKSSGESRIVDSSGTERLSQYKLTTRLSSYRELSPDEIEIYRRRLTAIDQVLVEAAAGNGEEAIKLLTELMADETSSDWRTGLQHTLDMLKSAVAKEAAQASSDARGKKEEESSKVQEDR